LKPLKGFLVSRRALTKLAQEFFMLLTAFLTVRPQKIAIPVRLRPAECIELVVAHHGEGCAGITHAFSYVKYLTLFRSTINEITYKDHSAIRVTKDSIHIAIVHLLQEAVQHLHMSMDIANEIVFVCGHELLSSWLQQSSSQRRFA
jgi:hypothetical protein